MAGNFPFSSQAWKKKVQSMYSRSSEILGSMTWVPTKGGAGRSSKASFSRFVRASVSVSRGRREVEC